MEIEQKTSSIPEIKKPLFILFKYLYIYYSIALFAPLLFALYVRYPWLAAIAEVLLYPVEKFNDWLKPYDLSIPFIIITPYVINLIAAVALAIKTSEKSLLLNFWLNLQIAISLGAILIELLFIF